MVIHTFGGYYGLAISWVLYRPNLHQSKRLNGSNYHSDVFAMIGERYSDRQLGEVGWPCFGVSVIPWRNNSRSCTRLGEKLV